MMHTFQKAPQQQGDISVKDGKSTTYYYTSAMNPLYKISPSVNDFMRKRINRNFSVIYVTPIHTQKQAPVSKPRIFA